MSFNLQGVEVGTCHTEAEHSRGFDHGASFIKAPPLLSHTPQLLKQKKARNKRGNDLRGPPVSFPCLFVEGA